MDVFFAHVGRSYPHNPLLSKKDQENTMDTSYMYTSFPGFPLDVHLVFLTIAGWQVPDIAIVVANPKCRTIVSQKWVLREDPPETLILWGLKQTQQTKSSH